MHGIVCLLALAANVLGSPVQPDQSPNNNLKVNTPQTASGCYHQYVLCQIAVWKSRRVLTRCQRLPDLLSPRSLHVPKR
ncbi:hypothetical protein ACQRIT_007387 [Beauveria bassiana]